MKKRLIAAAATMLTAVGCASDNGCYDGWGGAFGDPYGDGVVYEGGYDGDYLSDDVYLPEGAAFGPQIIVPGGETIPAPAGEPLPEPAT